MTRFLPLAAVCAATLLCAVGLHAATANDMVGIWVIDGAATWDKVRTSPQVSAQLAALTPEQREMTRTALIDSIANQTIEFTPDKVISINNGARREESYKVTKIDGDDITTESVDDQGKQGASIVHVSSSQLIVTNLKSPEIIVVLKHK